MKMTVTNSDLRRGDRIASGGYKGSIVLNKPARSIWGDGFVTYSCHNPEAGYAFRAWLPADEEIEIEREGS